MFNGFLWTSTRVVMALWDFIPGSQDPRTEDAPRLASHLPWMPGRCWSLAMNFPSKQKMAAAWFAWKRCLRLLKYPSLMANHHWSSFVPFFCFHQSYCHQLGMMSCPKTLKINGMISLSPYFICGVPKYQKGIPGHHAFFNTKSWS